jgi:hypothetical protein
LVCAYVILVFERTAYIDGIVLGRLGRFIAIGTESVAARDAGDLFCVLLVFCGRSARFFRLSVRRYASRSGLYLPFLRAVRTAPWIWASVATTARQFVPAAMGMDAHLLRVRLGEDYERGSAVASLHGDGRILSERSAAHLDRLVHAAFTALVPCFDSVRHARARVGSGVDAIFAAPLAHRVFLYCNPWEIGVIFTANYTFLNYLVLALGVLLLDDEFLLRFLPQEWKQSFSPEIAPEQSQPEKFEGFRHQLKIAKLSVIGFLFVWIFYATVAELIWMVAPVPVPTWPVVALEPFRIANRYGLFAVMTRGRYEIEFQGSDDGNTWVAYPFRYKPQDPAKPPGIYAPYQPRFDWNLWFASLGSWQEYPIVPRTEIRLLSNDLEVLNLFEGNPFPQKAPLQVRAVLWQYWFTTMAERRAQGLWWRRQLLGLYAPTIERDADGNIRAVEAPNVQPRH